MTRERAVPRPWIPARHATPRVPLGRRARALTRERAVPRPWIPARHATPRVPLGRRARALTREREPTTPPSLGLASRPPEGRGSERARRRERTLSRCWWRGGSTL